MRILVLTTVFPPETRSAAEIMGELCESLARRGHAVTVITGGVERAAGAARPARRGLLAREERDGVRVLRVPTLPIHRTRAPALLRGAGQLANALSYLAVAGAVGRVDVSLAYSPPLALGLVGAALGLGRGIPHVLNVQDLVPQYAIDLGILRDPTAIRLARWVERVVYRHARAISVHSPGNAAHLRAAGVPAGKVVVVPNWVDTARLVPASRETAFRRRAGLEGKFVALFAGMLGFAQDVDTIVEAGAALRDRPEIALVIVGEGVEKARLQARARALRLANVRFLPAVSREEYPEVVATADVCLATLQRSLACPVVPSKLLGYMAAGRPIVAAFPEGGDAPRVIAEAGCGICVPAGEPARLAAAIVEAHEDPERRRRWGERGRAFVEAWHDRERCVARYVELFEGLDGGGAGVR